MTKEYKNFKQVSKVIFGRGSFDQIEEVLAPEKRHKNAPFIFLVDDVFKNNATLIDKIPLENNDAIIYLNVTDEPKTSYIDTLRDQIIDKYNKLPSGIIGIGGGSVLDIAKAVSLMLTNTGSSSEYQGWDLIRNSGIYHVGIPTLSGTGAEVSRTTVLTGPEKKLGLNSDYTVFDQIILDPTLIKNVPADQRFYTGMDCYIHCIESLTGTYLNTFSQTQGEKALELCREVFLHKDRWDEESDDKIMMASYFGGISIAYSQVGVAHALSYGLSYLLGIHHGIGNCIVFNHLEEFYPKGVKEFRQMMNNNNITLPNNITAKLSDEEFDIMINVSLRLEPLWENALGKDWEKKITKRKLKELFQKI